MAESPATPNTSDLYSHVLSQLVANPYVSTTRWASFPAKPFLPFFPGREPLAASTLTSNIVVTEVRFHHAAAGLPWLTLTISSF